MFFPEEANVGVKTIKTYTNRMKSENAELEQYPTGPHIAPCVLFIAENSFGDVNGKIVADFGYGCGTLGLASALLDAH
ncbi:hypothetical protein RJ641_026870 [Dillenia turbinata]|uniref:Methyltransferase n=1 Tax=Dillenia turbinata TaxID=194707 RepID=A0AAN8ZP46_9MAGN